MNTTKGFILCFLGLFFVFTIIFAPFGVMLFEKGLDN